MDYYRQLLYISYPERSAEKKYLDHLPCHHTGTCPLKKGIWRKQLSESFQCHHQSHSLCCWFMFIRKLIIPTTGSLVVRPSEFPLQKDFYWFYLGICLELQVTKPMTTWWFQHIYKILIKLDHVRIMSPSREVNIQNPWNHHLDDHVVHPENASSTCTCHFNPPADFLAAAWRSLQSENILELAIKQTYHTWNKICSNRNNNQLNLTSLEKWTTLSKTKVYVQCKYCIYIYMFSIWNFKVMSPDFPTKIG